MSQLSTSKNWFTEDRFGLFIHWGPYSALGRGEQVLFREHLDQNAYAQMASRWAPGNFDANRLCEFAVESGAKYCVFTARHHDGYCLWDSKVTDYTSARLAPRRDFIQEYVEACRRANLRVGIYYSLADWRIPAYWKGPQKDPQGWRVFQEYVHRQVEELLTCYGKIDVIWFDGAWPHSARTWESEELIRKIRQWQPDILINNRLDAESQVGDVEQAGSSVALGDFGTPEHKIAGDPSRLWESCQVTTWRLWGYANGEHYRSAEQLLDMLCECASQGGNLLLNVGLCGQGEVPDRAVASLIRVGKWLRLHGDAIYRTERGDLTEFVTSGYQTRRGNTIYLIYRFWPKSHRARVAGLDVAAAHAELMSTGQRLSVRISEDGLDLDDLPLEPPTDLFPVIKLECEHAPRVHSWAKDRLWTGDASRMASWAAARGSSVWLNGCKPSLSRAGSSSCQTAIVSASH